VTTVGGAFFAHAVICLVPTVSSFTADAYITRTAPGLPLRHQHDRADAHFGEMPASLVMITESMGLGIMDGDTLQSAIALIHDRLVLLESGP
jgi:hypothetical protein